MTSISKNVYTNKLDDIADKYSNTYYRKIKMKPADAKYNTYFDTEVISNDKYPKFEVGDHERISKRKTFLQNVTLQIGQKKFLLLKKLKTLYGGYMQ